MDEIVKLLDLISKVVGAFILIIISLVVYIYLTFVKRFDSIENKTNSGREEISKELKDYFEKFESKIEKNLDKIEKNFTDKFNMQQEHFTDRFEKQEEESKEKSNKSSFEISMLNKQLIILENEYKHLNRRVNKLDGFDSTEY